MNSLRLTAITLTTLALASCSTFTQQKADEQPAMPKETAKQAAKQEQEATAAVTPTAEQQATAEATLQESVTEVVATGDTLSLPTAAPTYQSTSAIPGRSGLRMGRFAPPEEAASSSENAAPTPNAAELRGLRSPALPKNLPLDINGQSKSN